VDLTLPPSLAAELAELRRRIDAIETGRRVASEWTNRTVNFYGYEGYPVLTIGQLNPPATPRGIFVGTNTGGTILEASEDVGVTSKGLQTPGWRDLISARQAITSGGYTSVYETYLPAGLTAGQISFQVQVDVPSGSSLGLTVYVQYPPSAASLLTTAEVTVGPYTAYKTFTWSSDLDPGDTSAVLFRLDAARTAGAGTCYVYEPRTLDVAWQGGGSGWS
jgi:hypothetical protein